MNDLPTPNGPPSEEGARRNFTGWTCFAILVLFVMIAVGTSNAKAKPPRLDGHEGDEILLKQVLSTESLEKTLGASMSSAIASNHDTLSKTLDDPIAELVLEADSDLYASMLYAAMRTYQGQKVPVEHLKLLAKSKVPEDQAFYEIYSRDSLSHVQANQLVSKLPTSPFIYQAARVQALQKAGDSEAVARLISPLACLGTFILELGAFPFIGASLAVWLIFRRRLREKSLELKGIPLDGITPLDADRLAIRAAQILAIFVISGLVVMYTARSLRVHLTDAEMSAGGGILTICAIFALQRFPVDGKLIHLSTMGLNARNLGKDILLGIVGFLAEFPVAMILGSVSVTLMRWLPKPTHPAEALEHTHDLRTIIPILVSACIIAPFWEEIAFRGLLFPGIKKLMGGIVPGILLSSIIFASVHPQGIAEWLPLAFIGATSCYLSYQSRSLVPGMVMHGLHNAALCLLMLLS